MGFAGGESVKADIPGKPISNRSISVNGSAVQCGAAYQFIGITLILTKIVSLFRITHLEFFHF